jgi:hypothetical protein
MVGQTAPADAAMPDPLTILTGDIVASSRLGAGDLDALIAALVAAAAHAARWAGGSGDAAFTRFRGDGWQCLGPAPHLALRTALYLRAAVRAEGRDRDSRVSVGIGAGDAPSGAHDLSGASGPAFELSGRGLDGIGRAARFDIAWQSPPSDAPRRRAIFALCDEISRRWTPRQATVFGHMLAPGAATQSAVAEELGITQQMVAKHLRAGGDWALRVALEAHEASTTP